MRSIALSFAISLLVLSCAASEESVPDDNGNHDSNGGSLATAGTGGANAGAMTTAGAPSTTGGTTAAGGSANGTAGTMTGAAGTTTGTAGTATGGSGPVAATCTKMAAATGTPLLIDDLEDGNADVMAADGRAGGWWVSTDGTGTATPKSGAPVPETGGTPGKAVHVSGTGLTSWGASLAAAVADTTMGCYDASKFTGITVSLKGTGSVWISVLTAAVRAAPSDQRNHYKKQVALTGDWQTVTIGFSELTQPNNWGLMVPFDAGKIYGIDFGPVMATAPAATDYDIWVDNLSFK